MACSGFSGVEIGRRARIVYKVVGVNIKLARGDKKFKCTLKGGPPGKRPLGRFKNE